MNGKPWTPEDEEALRQLYPNTPAAELTSRFSRPIEKIYSKASRMGLHKTQEFLASDKSGRLRPGQSRPGTETTRFKPGQIPANKGLKRPGWAPGRMATTQFKRGDRTGIAARNWVPVGTVKTDTEGYQRIKIREAVHGEATGFGNSKVWPFLHRHTWEQHRGLIPAGFVVSFKDGNKQNCDLANLELVSRGDMARRNGMWSSLPRELAEVIQLNGVLKRKVRKLYGEKHD